MNPIEEKLKRLTLPFLVATAMTLASGCSNPADDMTQANVEEANETSDDTEVAGKIYTITEDSTVGFLGAKVTGSHTGGFHEISGEIKVADGTIVGQPSIVIDMESIWSDNDRLTGHLKNDDFFDVPNYPTSTFTVTSVEGSGENAKVTGNLDLHGVTKSITFPASISISDEEVKVAAEFAINRRDFNINYDGKANDLIRDNVGITLALSAKPE